MPPTSVSVAQLDQTLGGVEAAVARFGAALLELDDNSGRSALGAAPLQGGSAQAWGRARDQMSVLWAWYGALSDAVSSITERRQGPRLNDAGRLALWGTLTGPSIELPPDSLALARGCLPAGSEVATPTAMAPLLDLMSVTYQMAAETITSISAVWDMVIPRLDEIEQVLATAEKMAAAAGARLPNEGGPAHRRLEDLRAQALTDPLAVDLDAVSSVAGAVDRVRSAVEAAVASRNGLVDNLDTMSSDLDAARQSITEARTHADEVAAKIAGGAQTLSDLDEAARTLADLSDAAESARFLAAADWAAADRALQALRPRVSELAAQTHRLVEAAGAPLAQRRELRGRLDAYRAKAHALGRDEDPGLEALYQGARDGLYIAPCDLDQAAAAVSAYQHALSQASAKDGPL